eukprot:792535-Rhodomonas_salina.1
MGLRTWHQNQRRPGLLLGFQKVWELLVSPRNGVSSKTPDSLPSASSAPVEAYATSARSKAKCARRQTAYQRPVPALGRDDPPVQRVCHVQIQHPDHRCRPLPVGRL